MDHDHHHDDPDAPSNCEEALAEVYTYLDGELTDAKRLGIASHLGGCNPCFETFDFEAELRMVISTKAHADEVPETLRIRISEKLSTMRVERGADADVDGNDPEDGRDLGSESGAGGGPHPTGA
jgi:mycothiol system anti-sigma-R factor